MNKKLKQLNRKLLLQEYAFVKSDIEYKKTIIEENQSKFLEKVYEILGEERTKNKDIKEQEEKELITKEKKDWNQYSKKIQDKAKKLYRDISKRTHPDKDVEGVYSDFFTRAALAYEECQILELHEICNQLGIEYEIDEDEETIIKDKIEQKKEYIKTIENSYAYLWSIHDNEKARDLLVRQFVRATRGKL
jgi:hypothetical protein